ncbi:MAG: N-acetyltransferase [Actinobacteria bacterium]|nr:N-acetyltransferase [Actinomycetota bacterium]
MTGTSATGEVFRLEPLGVGHNERDHRAWMSSIDHIRRSPGFTGRRWPHMMALDENASDLAAHAEDFAARRGFTYTVLDGDDDVIGCVYIYPDDGVADAHVRSWVRADRAELDAVLRTWVAEWLRAAWPFEVFRYDGVEL